MDYSQFTKKLTLPTDFTAPERLTFKDIIAHPLTRTDLQADLEGVNSSIQTIQQTRGGSWPTEALTEAFDLLDLAWHEREFMDANSLAYVIYDTNDTYIGCFYLYAMGVRTELTEELLPYDVDASWWVTTAAYEAGYYQKVYDAMRQWLAADFPFSKVYYSNMKMPEPQD
ncbi:MAG TPA: hypothetical protein VD735_06680 [Candidatus Saccharimonadales bacterium]|nr:hypothetical protein [Candidatus Saccharimonadales bacterium]